MVVDSAVAPPLELHPDRLFPADPSVRVIARRLYAATRDLPLLCPHGHVEARLLRDDDAFTDPASLLITPDHYITRLLHASGVPLEQLGVGVGEMPEAAARTAWRALCVNWAVFRATPVRYWLEAQLVDLFGVTTRPSAATADLIFDQVSARLAQPDYRPRALAERFGIEVLATTDDPCASLAEHAELAELAGTAGTAGAPRVIPTFRPDRYLELAGPQWPAHAERLGRSADIDTGHYGGFIEALEMRRQHFIAHGATSTDHGHLDAGTEPLAPAEAGRIYQAGRAGQVTPAEATAFRRHMMFEMARMSVEDGLAMAMHPGVRRGHHAPTTAAYGPDTGHDIPVQVEFTEALRPLLERFGTHPNLNLVLFTVDETTFSRELAPLAGFYPSIYLGAPWWFLDAPDAIRRYRAAVTETAGFSRTAGFVDDTRAFCSIPARHEMSRRLDAGVLARLVAEHRLDEDEALDTAIDLVAVRPRVAFKL
jgi:glucuronate isomerase